jgi:steroid 5-alpha reductase family enzyme
MDWTTAGLAFVAALAVSSMGFYRLVYFISVGYGFSVTAIAVLAFALTGAHASWPSVIQLTLLVIYGTRLAVYIVIRERQPQYASDQAEIQKTGAKAKLGVKIAIWVSVSLLYVLMTLPGLVSALGSTALLTMDTGAVVWAGLAIMAAGLILETVADAQKSAFKKKFPKEFCRAGVYRFVRCPNYLGEILFWLGNFVAGIVFYGLWWLWAGSALGLVCIVLIMMGSTKRLEAKQAERYGNREDFQAYCKSVPVLFPFVPVYTLKNLRVFLE